MKKKEKKNTWETYGASFWHLMTVLSVVLVVLGVIVLGFAVLRLVYKDRWFFWYVLAFAGTASIMAGIFCMDLFPLWGSVVRKIRLSEARMSGAMSVSQINKYEEREDKRNTEIQHQISESVGQVGREVKESSERLNNIEGRMQDMNARMERIADDNGGYDELKMLTQAMLQGLERSFNRKIDDLHKSIDTLSQSNSSSVSATRQIAEQLAEMKKAQNENTKLENATEIPEGYQDSPVTEKTGKIEKHEDFSIDDEGVVLGKTAETKPAAEEKPATEKAADSAAMDDENDEDESFGTADDEDGEDGFDSDDTEDSNPEFDELPDEDHYGSEINDDYF